jgi:Reverse transcriptase (RNA-dependent DNA polymerase)
MYLVHVDINYLREGVQLQRHLLGRIGRAKKLFRDLGPPIHLCHDNITTEFLADRSQTLNEIDAIRNEMLNNNIFDLPLATSPDVFMEILLMAVRNEVLGYQTFFKKSTTELKNNLEKSLAELKGDYSGNIELISKLEAKITAINNAELRSKIENFSQFEILNNEKMTPFFLKLCKGSKNSAELNIVCDDNGKPFLTDYDRDEYIVRYFENVYKVPENHPINLNGCVERFLGEFANHDLVMACKLNNDKKNHLDRPLTIDELDLSVTECKINTAGGPDGLNNRFLKKFWHYIRTPLFKYAGHCFDTGRLSETFRGANIRLIPKKGDATHIKEWRPILLLPCCFKIISRAINNRVKKFTDRFTSRAQKGFTKNRYIQEVLLNVLQNIYFCRNNNIDGAIVSIDFRKAFDTIYHDFIRDCYRFLGVGENMIKIFDTLGTNRTASIILCGGKISRPFQLGTGRPQGEILSPGQFNVGEQMLLFRIELDPAVASVYQHMMVPRSFFVPDPESIPINYRHESCAETDKADCFADDASGSTILEQNNMHNFKGILDELSVISGLQCNYEKTFVMPTSDRTDANLIQALNEMGFVVSTSLKLLGFKLTNRGIDSEDFSHCLLEKKNFNYKFLAEVPSQSQGQN